MRAKAIFCTYLCMKFFELNWQSLIIKYAMINTQCGVPVHFANFSKLLPFDESVVVEKLRLVYGLDVRVVCFIVALEELTQPVRGTFNIFRP